MMKSSAKLSPSRKYRWWLKREWDPRARSLTWIMLNPSTADESKNDPTLNRIIMFSQKWVYGSLTVVNLFPYRSSTTEEVKRWLGIGAINVRERNTREILKAARNSDRVVAAWGAAAWAQPRAEYYTNLMLEEGIHLYCLGLTQSGCPKHPLARGIHTIPADAELERYTYG